MTTRYIVTGHNPETDLSTTTSTTVLAEALDLVDEMVKAGSRVTLEQTQVIGEWVDGRRNDINS